MQQLLGSLSGVLIAASVAPYIRDILRRKTRPQRATWLIWSVLLVIAFVAQLFEGGTWSVLSTGVDLLGVLIIFALSIRFGVGGTTKLDIVALLGSAVGLLLWYLTQIPLVALLITIVIDALGGMLTIVKTYAEPETETFATYVLCGTGGLLGALAVGDWDLALLIFPLWIGVLNYAIAATVVLGKRKRAAKRER